MNIVDIDKRTDKMTAFFVKKFLSSADMPINGFTNRDEQIKFVHKALGIADNVLVECLNHKDNLSALRKRRQIDLCGFMYSLKFRFWYKAKLINIGDDVPDGYTLIGGKTVKLVTKNDPSFKSAMLCTLVNKELQRYTFAPNVVKYQR